jgi:hypothetical protein
VAVAAWRIYNAIDTVETVVSSVTVLASATATNGEKLAASVELGGSFLAGRSGRQAASGAVRAVGGGAAKAAGDLTRAEIRQIQNVVNEAGRPPEVVGSAAAGTRRGVGTSLPLGKGPGTRSDIDYVVGPSSSKYYDGLQGKLPSIDPKTGIIPGNANPHIGPSIRFEPQ